MEMNSEKASKGSSCFFPVLVMKKIMLDIGPAEINKINKYESNLYEGVFSRCKRPKIELNNEKTAITKSGTKIEKFIELIYFSFMD
jgi:hypothetical protein